MNSLYMMYTDLMYSKLFIDMLLYSLFTNYLIEIVIRLIIRLLINFDSVLMPSIRFIYIQYVNISSTEYYLD